MIFRPPLIAGMLIALAIVISAWTLNSAGNAPSKAQESPPSGGAAKIPEVDPAATAGPTYETPSQIFEELTKLTKPVWRVQYRTTIVRAVNNRAKAALGLGAIMTDLALAGMARDTQQVRNLLQDEEALEKLLGITDKMASQRQRIAATADASDWPGLLKAVRRSHERQAALLEELRDGDLARLVSAGLWLRAWQISTNVVIDKKLENDRLSVGSQEMVSALSQGVDAISQKVTDDKCLSFLARKTFALAKTWRSTDPAERAERLQLTQGLLSDIIDQLIQNKPASPKSAPAEAPRQ